MPYYPAYLDLRGRPCIVIGGGEIAARKVASFREAGARVTVVSPTLTGELRGLADTRAIVHHARAYQRGDLDGAWLACVATDDEALHAAIAAEAAEARVFLNVVDRPRLGGFIVPAVVRRGPVRVAVSTGGASPALAKRLARELDATLGAEWGVAARVLGALRARLDAGDASARGRIFSALADAPLLRAIRERDAARVEALLSEHVGARTTLAELGIDLAPGADR
ncbi:MAG: bifunctional precorrin-2 dehydrogenase/sirohydrochlorin ferrochelatase [Deltaproteobacteria bacterium]|nr:bifunctional precorrin-2 dehydrogenase/sirohydrochlorin ferrochelatase [Deltaproteobacteria bacterium]